MTVPPAEEAAMRRAIVLSAFGLGSTSPNPPVGCVILDSSGQVVGQGYHLRKGEPHAEANALEAAGDRARGGTAVVTLEPCNHFGRTPPCHQALLDAGVTRVVIAVLDPTSRGDGGVARMRQAGVVVETGILADEARLVLGPWLSALRKARPSVVWAYAIDADGILRAVGERQLPHNVDVVLHEDGTVTERVAGSHGDGVVSLAPVNLADGPQAVLAQLYQGGSRCVALNGDHELTEPFISHGFIDQAVGHLAYHDPTSRPRSGSEFFLPPGFRLSEATRCGQYVRVVAVPAVAGF